MDFNRKQPKQPDTSCGIALTKSDGESYVYVFDEATTSQTLRAIAKNAADKELSLTWHEAALLSAQVRALDQLLD